MTDPTPVAFFNEAANPSVIDTGTCPACAGRHTHGSGRPNGVDCSCGRHFHFGDELWIRSDKCIVCPSCGKALSALDFGPDNVERLTDG